MCTGNGYCLFGNGSEYCIDNWLGITRFMAAGESYSFCFTKAFDFRWPAVAGKQMKDPFTVDYLAVNGELLRGDTSSLA